MIKTTCDYCHREYETQAAWLRKRKNHYCSKDCKNAHHGVLYSNENHHQWIGRRTKHGYILIHDKAHPNADAQGYVQEHVVIMSKHIGLGLAPNEVVHHINHITDDNRIENLQLMDYVEHNTLHARQPKPKRPSRAKPKPIAQCKSCGKDFPVDYKGKMFCSMKCFGASKKLPPKVCLTCGKTFVPALSHYVTCSNSCGVKLGHKRRRSRLPA